MSENEFQEWWRKQPTFLTFEDWLREEEEMRKMGSKPCPVCGTLNSVTATVCHKCGSLMREQRPPGGAGGPVVATGSRRPSSPGSGPSEGGDEPQTAPYGSSTAAGAAPGTVGIPRRVFKKPGTSPPVVQKRVIKKPVEGEGSEGQSDSSGESSTQDDL